jgi:hypothetical protein
MAQRGKYDIMKPQEVREEEARSLIKWGTVVFLALVVIWVLIERDQFQFLAPHIGTLLGGLLGFVSGWGLFEIGEQRRRRIQQRTIREALKAELRNMEGVLNQMLFMFAWGAEDPGRGVQEMR